MKILELNILEFGGLKDRSLSLSDAAFAAHRRLGTRTCTAVSS